MNGLRGGHRRPHLVSYATRCQTHRCSSVGAGQPEAPRKGNVMKWIWSLLLALLAVLAVATSAHAAVLEAIPGKMTTGGVEAGTPAAAGPVSVIVNDKGSLMAKRGSWFETVPGMFFGVSSAPSTNWHLRVKGAPAENVTFGVRDTAPTPISNGPVTGSWTAASPARIDTVMRAGENLFEIKQTVLYVAPELSFRVIWDIRNISAQTVPFIFGISADLFIECDAGEGVLLAGPPRFLGGRNKFTGTIGGVQEVLASQLPEEASPTAVPPWASYEEGDPFPVTRRLSNADAFLNTINPLFMDNGVGVSWNDRATAGLPAGQTARYEVVWQLSRAGATTLSAPPRAASAASPAVGPEAPPAPPGESSVVTARDGSGTPAGDARGAATTAGAQDATAPVLSALRVARAPAGRAPKFVFRLSERADVVLRIAR
ncbi:MAG TPA: hypothetical protein VM266_16230, partial [Solirubrobacteraceae bacterium]|nr:hypothetical protein [Solirubrobacteraceae bacterium]